MVRQVESVSVEEPVFYEPRFSSTRDKSGPMVLAFCRMLVCSRFASLKPSLICVANRV